MFSVDPDSVSLNITFSMSYCKKNTINEPIPLTQHKSFIQTIGKTVQIGWIITHNTIPSWYSYALSLFVLFFETGFPYVAFSLGCTGTHSVHQAGLKHTESLCHPSAWVKGMHHHHLATCTFLRAPKLFFLPQEYMNSIVHLHILQSSQSLIEAISRIFIFTCNSSARLVTGIIFWLSTFQSGKNLLFPGQP